MPARVRASAAREGVCGACRNNDWECDPRAALRFHKDPGGGYGLLGLRTIKPTL